MPKLEGAQRDTEALTDVVRGIERLYGAKLRREGERAELLQLLSF